MSNGSLFKSNIANAAALMNSFWSINSKWNYSIQWLKNGNKIKQFHCIAILKVHYYTVYMYVSFSFHSFQTKVFLHQLYLYSIRWLKNKVNTHTIRYLIYERTISLSCQYFFVCSSFSCRWARLSQHLFEILFLK